MDTQAAATAEYERKENEMAKKHDSKKRYYIPGVDEIHQMVETTASKERTEKERFVINTVICVISALAAVVAAVASILALILR